MLYSLILFSKYIFFITMPMFRQTDETVDWSTLPLPLIQTLLNFRTNNIVWGGGITTKCWAYDQKHRLNSTVVEKLFQKITHESYQLYTGCCIRIAVDNLVRKPKQKSFGHYHSVHMCTFSELSFCVNRRPIHVPINTGSLPCVTMMTAGFY